MAAEGIRMRMGLKAATKETLWAYLFLLPNLFGFLVFTLLPVAASFVLSFVDWDILSPPKFVGLGNFINLLGFHMENARIVANDPLFWKFLGNTLFLMLGIPIGMMASLAVAVAMNQKIKGMVFFRTIYFLPTISSGVAICILWKWIYNPDFGLLNSAIASLGQFLHVPLQGPNWLSSTAWAKPALMLMSFWVGLGGYNMILYLASLQGISHEFYEAADIDGANEWQKFWAITWPIISPTTFFIAIMSIIGGFQGGFMAARVMTGGGPHYSTTTIEYYIFMKLYDWQAVGYAATIAWILFLMIFIVTIINWRFGGKLVHY